MEIVGLSTVSRLIGVMAPDWAWFLQHLESEDGYVKFPPQLSLVIRNLNIENYPELYENEAAIGGMMLRAFLEPDQIKELESQLVLLSPEERGKFLEEVVGEIRDAGEGIEIAETFGERKRALRMFHALSPTEKQQSILFLQRFTMAFLASFYQSLSVMVHGEKLTALVTQAKAGNDKAFAKAVQIDKRILSGIPYFKKRFIDAQLEGDRKFTEEIGAHLSRPPYKGRIRHKSLWMALAFIDMCGWLNIPHAQLLEVLDNARFDRYANRIDDVKL